MHHCVTRIGPVPVTFPRFNPNRIARTDYLRWSPRQLHPANSGQHVQSLSHRMRVPRGPCPRLEGNAIHRKPCWNGRRHDLIDPHCPSEPILRSFAATAHLVGKYFHFSTPHTCHRPSSWRQANLRQSPRRKQRRHFHHVAIIVLLLQFRGGFFVNNSGGIRMKLQR
jgi:hypothetical protein